MNEKSESFPILETPTKIRDNFHTIIVARNMEGVKELNLLVSKSNDKEHFYFKPRISFDEFLGISDNLISTSACLASPLWSGKKFVANYEKEMADLEKEIELLEAELEKVNLELSKGETVRGGKKRHTKLLKDKLRCEQVIKCQKMNISEIKKDWFLWQSVIPKIAMKYRFLEVQPHTGSKDQKVFNDELRTLSGQLNTPLICGTDTHSIDSYKAECRTILQTAKDIEFLDEDTFDLTAKTYNEVYDMFVEQGVLSREEITECMQNTQVLADMCEDIKLDLSFKYPIYKSKEEDAKMFSKLCWDKLEDKIQSGIIQESEREKYTNRIIEELRVLEKVGMLGFMLSMADFIGEARDDGIPFGPARGSAGGCLSAYIVDITDLDSVVWNTEFSRFCNEDRIESGD